MPIEGDQDIVDISIFFAHNGLLRHDWICSLRTCLASAKAPLQLKEYRESIHQMHDGTGTLGLRALQDVDNSQA